METDLISKQFTAIPYDNKRLALLSGIANENITNIENLFCVNIMQRGNVFHIKGSNDSTDRAHSLLNDFYNATNCDKSLAALSMDLKTQKPFNSIKSLHGSQDNKDMITLRNKKIILTGKNQKEYVANIRKNAINFAIGPAGTGKTYLAVALALEEFDKGNVGKLIFVRPAVEAGEKLGFLPGAIEEKIFPFLIPLYDALYDHLGFAHAQKLLQKHVIEIVPLAFMRGRTLKKSFIILDEAQNTTPVQMKMFLTRMGHDSKIIVTGDLTQVDLPEHKDSGLNHAIEVLKDIPNLKFNYFNSHDTVRHPLVKSILNAYDK